MLVDAIVLYIDLGTKPSVRRDLPQFVAEEIKGQLLAEHGIDIDERNFVRGVYHSDLQRFEGSIHGELKEHDPDGYKASERKFLTEKLANLDGHIRESLGHLTKARRQQVVIFLDNVDQRPHEFQQEVFLIGTSIAAEWPVTVFITIRPESYYRSRATGALTAYHPKAFTIAPPRLDIVIQKRLEYALYVMDGGALSSLPGVSIEVGKLKSYIEVLLHSFTKGRDLIEFCDNMAGGNIRLALDFAKTFIGSGHVNTNKILDIYESTGRYIVPLHEFLRAVIFRDYEYFDPGTSELMNLFDLWTADSREHFLVPILLAHAERTADPAFSGYVRTVDLLQHVQDLGFSPEQGDWALSRCLAKKLVDRPARSIEESEGTSTVTETEYVRITSIGAYYVKKLVANFSYVDAVIVDTPITHQTYRDQIRDVATVTERLARAEIFRAYLDEVWASVPGKGIAFDWNLSSGFLKTDIRGIARRVNPT